MRQKSVFLSVLAVCVLAVPHTAEAFTCPPHFTVECDIGPRGKPLCVCIADETPPITGTVTPNYYVTHVLYAVPGKSSAVAYTSGSTFGSTSTLDNSFTSDEKVTVSSGGGIIGTADITVTTGASFGNTSTDSTDIAITLTRGYTKFGEDDFVNHDDDEIWFLVRPLIDVSFTDASHMSWSFRAGQQLVPYWVYVGWLKAPSSMPPPVKSYLDSVGITASYYPELLKADPYAYGDVPIDPGRFDLPIGNNFPYEPPLNPGDKPSIQTSALLRDVTNSSTVKETTTYMVGYSVSGSVDFLGLFSSKVTVANNLTFTMSTSTKLSDKTSEGETITIGQPLYGYTGPTHVKAYVDKIWKTFLFRLESQ